MAEQHPRTYMQIELVSTSPTRYAEATTIDEGRFAEYQVTVTVGFQVLAHPPA